MPEFDSANFDSPLLNAHSIHPEEYPIAQAILEQSFPLQKLHPQSAFEARFQDPTCDALLFSLDDNPKAIGIYIGWQLYDFHFAEYLAFLPEVQDQGLETRWIKTLMYQYDSLVCEMDAPQTTIQKQNLAFYESLGFHVLRKDYFLPGLQGTNPPIPMWLLTTNKDLDPLKTTESIYTEVYEHAMKRPQNKDLIRR